MEIIAISDIHGNLEALEAVLEDALDRPHRFFVCAGDIVGYGPNPNECTELVAEHCDVTVVGNHDLALLDGGFHDAHPNAVRAMRWAVDNVSQGTIDFLSSLPREVSLEGEALLTHPHDGPLGGYIFNDSEASLVLRSLEEPIAIIGHTHQPGPFNIRGGKHAINVGSVGQPRDKDPRACYAVIDTKGDGWVDWHRVEYDIAAVQKKIKAAGLPERMASRLSEGR